MLIILKSDMTSILQLKRLTVQFHKHHSGNIGR